MATHSSILAWRIPGTGEPSGLPSMGSHRVRHNWSDTAAVLIKGSLCFRPVLMNIYVHTFCFPFGHPCHPKKDLASKWPQDVSPLPGLTHSSTIPQNNHYTIQLNTVILSKQMLLRQFQKSTPNSEMNERIKRFFHHVHFINALTGHWHSPPLGEFNQQQAKIPPSSANINSKGNSGARAHFFL